jgi:hypothetical protein
MIGRTAIFKVAGSVGVPQADKRMNRLRRMGKSLFLIGVLFLLIDVGIIMMIAH